MKEDIEQLIKDYEKIIENYPNSNDYRRGIIDGATIILSDLKSTISDEIKLDPDVQEILDDVFNIRG